MNSTMADGAAQRLVAQLGEALFGQPGLTLMELTEMPRAAGSATPSAHAALLLAPPYSEGGSALCGSGALSSATASPGLAVTSPSAMGSA